MRLTTLRRALVCEQLESRLVLSSLGQEITSHAATPAGSVDMSDFYPVIVAGASNGTPADSPGSRVDANTSGSAFAGVGSLQIAANRGTFICTGTAIDTFHVLTAGHCVDLNDDGVSNKKDGIRSITFNLNLDTDAGTDQVDVQIAAASWVTHPDFTGFNRPSINDDLAVITLGGSGIPAGVPTYSVSTSAMSAGTRLYMVGYGRSGDGVSGYTTNASFTIKRTGGNVADAFYGQDDAGRSAADEVFRFDFDGPTGNGSFGGPTLANNVETTLGGGDSGGPSFALCTGCDPALASSYTVVGVNTFTQGTNAPKFGSLGGGINVGAYSSWIQSAQGTIGSTGGGNGNGGNGGGGPPPGNAMEKEENSFVIMPPEAPSQVLAIAIPSQPTVLQSDASSSDVELRPSPVSEPAAAGSIETVSVASSAASDLNSTSGRSDGLPNAVDLVLQDWPAVVGK
jgi:Trypsin